MNTAILDNQSFECSVEQAQKSPGVLQQLLYGWCKSQSDLQRQWRKFSTFSGTRHVSYRAWSRHGAYLEMNLKQRRH